MVFLVYLQRFVSARSHVLLQLVQLMRRIAESFDGSRLQLAPAAPWPALTTRIEANAMPRHSVSAHRDNKAFSQHRSRSAHRHHDAILLNDPSFVFVCIFQSIIVPKNMFKTSLTLICLAISALSSHAFVTAPSFGVTKASSSTASFMDVEDFLQETPEATKERIQDLVDENPVLLFMKGSKVFPQCGFSNTAVQILTSFGIPFHTVGKWFPVFWIIVSNLCAMQRGIIIVQG